MSEIEKWEGPRWRMRCLVCDGSGMVTPTRETREGVNVPASAESVCATCGGSGEIRTVPTGYNDGTGPEPEDDCSFCGMAGGCRCWEHDQNRMDGR
jgi:DnaJ-class molecular chaperone